MQRRSVGLYCAANFELREVLEGMLTSALQSQQRECFRLIPSQHVLLRIADPSSGKAGLSRCPIARFCERVMDLVMTTTFEVRSYQHLRILQRPPSLEISPVGC
jgi:hypothetical protein